MAVLAEDGMLLESAQGPIDNAAELIAGEAIRGSWWGHPAGQDIYAALNRLAESPDVARLRLVNGKITLVHRRVWPALACLEAHFPPAALARVDQVHTASGSHRAISVPFDEWLPADARRAGAALDPDEAIGLLPECLRPAAPEPRP